MILLDTVVLSELRKRTPNQSVVRWLQHNADSQLFGSDVSVGEIKRSIEKQRKTNPPFAEELARWLDDLLYFYGDRVLPATPDIARRWGLLSARFGNNSADLMIAATALVHGLAVTTRNVNHFTPTGVGITNPIDD